MQNKIISFFAASLLYGVPISCYADFGDYSGPDSSDAFTTTTETTIEPYNKYQEREVYSPSSDKYQKVERVAKRSSSRRSRLPDNISAPGEKVIIVDPRAHAWGAYNARGQLLRSGLATAGGKWCADIGRSCRTKTGTFSIASLGSSSCISKKYPIDEGGGAPMPYCMFFNGGQGIHGSYNVVAANVSHGCVRVSVDDAEWIRFNFARVGTKVIIKPY
jgi:lipoprotein-anchoring transpeptidase ErfK/SrfK